MSQDPQPLDRRSSDGTLRAGKRLPLDRRVLNGTLRAGKRLRGGPRTRGALVILCHHKRT